MKDPYRRVAGVYDRLFEPINQGLRVLGVRMFLPPKGASILDIGCGTGVHLEMYQRFGCSLHGVDASPSMLKLARARLGEAADLRLADAARLTYGRDFFDLVICMLTLHEMDPPVRGAVLNEIGRVLKRGGFALLIDFHDGRPRHVKGWLNKLVILASEIAAGRRHFRNYRHFMSTGGLPTLIAENHMTVEKGQVVGENTMALYLAKPV